MDPRSPRGPQGLADVCTDASPSASRSHSRLARGELGGDKLILNHRRGELAASIRGTVSFFLFLIGGPNSRQSARRAEHIPGAERIPGDRTAPHRVGRTACAGLPLSPSRLLTATSTVFTAI